MNPLLKKEIRLVLPAWLAVLLLELGMPWLGPDRELAITYAPFFFFFGMVLLAVDSFGREFSLGTFASLMSQPVARHQIWRTKLAVLLAAAAVVFAGYFASCELRLHLVVADGHSTWAGASPAIRFGAEMLASVASLLVALAGGLWTALLFRQTAAAFWIALLAPLGLGLLLFYLSSMVIPSPSLGGYYALAGIYVAAAFWLAHRLFYRAEDAGWTGGVISFSRWRYFDRTRPVGLSQRKQRPGAALLKKELQLHSVSLFGAAALLGLHLLIFLLRAEYTNFHKNTVANVATDCFWLLWLILPLVIGCTAVAEERKLGVMEEQLSLPIPRRRQLLTKLIVSLVLGVVLGGVLPLVLENAAATLGSPGAFFSPAETPLGLSANGFQLGVLVATGALVMLAFYASTLARNFLQALSLAIIFVVSCCLVVPSLARLGGALETASFLPMRVSLFGSLPTSLGLLAVISLPVLAFIIPWIFFRNFCHFQESGRLWRRNLLAVPGVCVGIWLGSSAIYQRSWEILEPAEQAHGAAKISTTDPVRLQGGTSGAVQVGLPDGRVWCDNQGYIFWNDQPSYWETLWLTLAHPLPQSTGPGAFITGSNWSSAAALHLFGGSTDTSTSRVSRCLNIAAIRTDGTLWISETNPATASASSKMIPFGSETNWAQVVRKSFSYLLLKNDGTLWQWNRDQIAQPRQVGTNSDWRELVTIGWGEDYARKTDGSTWLVSTLSGTNSVLDLHHDTNLDHVELRTLSEYGNHQAYVGRDGTLWLAGLHVKNGQTEWDSQNFFQIGRETNWVSVSLSGLRMAALKNDGSLWQWELTSLTSASEIVRQPPVALGIHHDWRGLCDSCNGSISLAADGSLWYWPDHAVEPALWLKLPKQPQWVGNILAENEPLK